MQLLAKFKNILYVRFRATLNFRKFTISILSAPRNNRVDMPKNLKCTEELKLIVKTGASLYRGSGDLRAREKALGTRLGTRES